MTVGSRAGRGAGGRRGVAAASRQGERGDGREGECWLPCGVVSPSRGFSCLHGLGRSSPVQRGKSAVS